MKAIELMSPIWYFIQYLRKDYKVPSPARGNGQLAIEGSGGKGGEGVAAKHPEEETLLFLPYSQSAFFCLIEPVRSHLGIPVYLTSFLIHQKRMLTISPPFPPTPPNRQILKLARTST